MVLHRVVALSLLVLLDVPSAALAVNSQAIHNHFQAMPDWRRRNNDGWLYNSQYQNVQISRVAVGWMATLEAVRQANQLGCQLLITYGPLYAGSSNHPAAREKRDVLDSSRMVVLRLHDVWERYPAVGTRDSLRAFLQLDPVRRNSDPASVSVHAVTPQSALAWAQHVADRFRTLGVGAVELVGNKAKPIALFAIGDGLDRDARAMMLQGADAGLIKEFQRWRELWWAIDNNFPVIIVDHQAADLPGVRNLKLYIERQWPQLNIVLVDSGPLCQWRQSALGAPAVLVH